MERGKKTRREKERKKKEEHWEEIGTFVWTNGTEKTVDRAIVLQSIADVVKLELVGRIRFLSDAAVLGCRTMRAS